jgi:hypothetical protein
MFGHRPVSATTVVRPQEQQDDNEETLAPLPPAEQFIEPTPPIAPVAEPFEVPLPAPQSPLPETEESPTSSAGEQPAFEDQSQTITTGISKPKNSRKLSRSQKTTEDIPAPTEAIGHSTGTNLTFDALEEQDE